MDICNPKSKPVDTTPLRCILEEKHSKYSANVNLLLSRRFTRASFRFNTRSVCDNRRRNPYEIPKTVSPENSTVTLFLSRLPSQLDQSAMAALPAEADQTSPP